MAAPGTKRGADEPPADAKRPAHTEPTDAGAAELPPAHGGWPHAWCMPEAPRDTWTRPLVDELRRDCTSRLSWLANDMLQATLMPLLPPADLRPAAPGNMPDLQHGCAYRPLTPVYDVLDYGCGSRYVEVLGMTWHDRNRVLFKSYRDFEHPTKGCACYILDLVQSARPDLSWSECGPMPPLACLADAPGFKRSIMLGGLPADDPSNIRWYFGMDEDIAEFLQHHRVKLTFRMLRADDPTAGLRFVFVADWPMFSGVVPLCACIDPAGTPFVLVRYGQGLAFFRLNRDGTATGWLCGKSAQRIATPLDSRPGLLASRDGKLLVFGPDGIEVYTTDGQLLYDIDGRAAIGPRDRTDIHNVILTPSGMLVVHKGIRLWQLVPRRPGSAAVRPEQ